MSYGQAGSLVKDSRPTHGSPSPNTKWQPRAMSKACINPFNTKTCYASYGLTASACRSQAGLQGCGVGISWGGGRRLWIRRTSILHTSVTEVSLLRPPSQPTAGRPAIKLGNSRRKCCRTQERPTDVSHAKPSHRAISFASGICWTGRERLHATALTTHLCSLIRLIPHGESQVDHERKERWQELPAHSRGACKPVPEVGGHAAAWRA